MCDGILLPGDSADLSMLPAMGDDGEQAWAAAAARYGVDMSGDRDWRTLTERRGPAGHLRGFTLACARELFHDCVIRSRRRFVECRELVELCRPLGAEGQLNVDWLEIDSAHRVASDSSELRLVFGDDE